MLNPLKTYWYDIRDRQRINIALTRGAAMSLSRQINLSKPWSWEFSGFSQNGEDGILDVLRKQLSDSNRYFIEIGAADGIANNTAWLLMAERYNGIMIEGDPALVTRAKRMVIDQSNGAECYQMFVTKESATDIFNLALHKNPDVFSLDIDGNDYYVAKALFETGLRPKICVVEYNSAFGKEKCCTIEYNPDFICMSNDDTGLYYGVSIAGWIKYFSSMGYRFITVDSKGVNAFFVDAEKYDNGFLDKIQPLEFAENHVQLMKFRVPCHEQFDLISHHKFKTL